jgi:uncharacterized phage protein gp47/JayE
MIIRPSITVDPRDAAAILAELQSRRPGYVPEWNPSSQDAGWALSLIAARYAQAVVQRLNQAPDKNKLAFLDMLGEQPSPARAARAPIVFQLASGAAGGSAPAGTEIAAPPPPGASQQIVFQTENDVGITPGKLAQVFSFWPGRDEYIDHSADFLAGATIDLFAPDALAGVPHILYLAHNTLLNLSGNIVLSVEFQLTHPSSDRLDIAWEYWDGKIWRGFKQLDPACAPQTNDHNDGTNGLTSSGSIRLSADSTKGNQTSVNGLNAYWIRGRLDQTLPPDPSKPLPEVESIRISSLVNKPFTTRLSGVAQLSVQIMEIPPLFGGGPFPTGFSGAVFTLPSSQMTGKVVNEAGEPLAGTTIVISDPANVNYGKRTTTSNSDGTFSILLDDFGTNHVMQFDVTFFNVTSTTQFSLLSNTASVILTFKIAGLTLDKAFNDGTKLDTSKPFFPFGAQPQPGTVFYFNNAETFAKPGARFRLYLPKTLAPSDKLALTPSGTTNSSIVPLEHLIAWEYWNGREWAGLSFNSTQQVAADFIVTEVLDFRVPVDIVPVAVNKDPDLWMRARLVSGGFGFTQSMSFNSNTFNILITQPPMLASVAVSYAWQFGPFYPETVLTYNDFQYQDHTYESTWPGSSFLPYQRTDDVSPTLYLGFDQKPPTADIGIFFEIDETPSASAPPAMVWEYWDGFEWTVVSVEDETGALTAPGILSYIAEDDSAPLARFGTSLHWLRGRLKEDGPPNEAVINGIYPNAVWALQQRSFNSVPLGTATGQPGEVFQVTQIPIIPGERLEVRELFGARANVEWRLIALDLSLGNNDFVRQLEDQLGKEGPAVDIVLGDIRLKRDKQKLVSEVWVRWYSQPNLFLSSPTDRYYAMDRARGLVFFGDGVSGRALPQDSQVSLQQFQSGGGTEGNVDVKTITQLLGAVSGVQSVFNPRAAEGGSDAETLQSFRNRAPASLRHRGRALTAGDYEAMVREASSAVAVVKAIPNRNQVGRRVPGWLTIFVIPESKAPQPYPSRGMRDEVLAYIAERASAGLVQSGHINVTGPTYFAVDVTAVIAPIHDKDAGPVETSAVNALSDFLHPLYGGPSGDGWDFGRGVYLSDVALVLESVAGLDHAESIQLLVNNSVQGVFAPVPADQIVVAGNIRLKVKGAGD